MKTILVIAAALFAIMIGDCARADDRPCEEWCKPYWKSMPKSEFVFDAALAADMLTTLDIKNHPGIHETNFILGEHPSDAKIIGYTLLAAGLHSMVTYELVDNDVPKPIIRAWEYLSIGVEVGYAVHNYHIGLRFAL